MDLYVMDFLKNSVFPHEIKGKRVLEVGSLNVNGTGRTHLNSLSPAEYIGVDMRPGVCVDVVCDAENVVNTFSKETFDFVLSTEMLEHVQRWRLAITNLKQVLRPGGVILITTRSPGFGYHGYPNDFWRFTRKAMYEIFADFISTHCFPLPNNGVALKAVKPDEYYPNDLTNIAVDAAPLQKK